MAQLQLDVHNADQKCKPHHFHPTIIREYDIRGLVDNTLHNLDAFYVGKSFGSFAKRKGAQKICLGFDGRHSSPIYADYLCEGLTSCGLDVIRVDLGPTPMLYFSVEHYGAQAGVMITGSHNPPEYNGFKMVFGKGPVYGEEIVQIGQIAKKAEFEYGKGTVTHQNVHQAYLDSLVKAFTASGDYKIAWDCGNGATGNIVRDLVKALPGQHFLLHDEVDGSFPNHHPDPTVEENLDDLRKCVADNKCHMGIGFDGDGDRIGAIDQNGRIVWGDQLLAIYAKEVLQDNPGATVIADVKASQVLFDKVKEYGGNPIMWKTGHSLIKAKMRETGAKLAGEMSGHIIVNDKGVCYDDAIYDAVRLISLCARYKKSLAELCDELPQTLTTPEVRFQVDESRKFKVIQEIQSRLKNETQKEVCDLDGVRVTTKDGWWLLRASNTQDVIVARAEAFDEDGFARLKQEICDELIKSGVTPPQL